MESDTNNTSVIHVSKGTHYGKTVIICSFAYDNTILNVLKTIPTLRYSKTLRSWYLPYTKEDWAAFTALGLAYQIIHNITNQNTTIQDKITGTIHNPILINSKNAISPDTAQKHHSDQTGTASSPIESDIAGIAAHTVAPSVYPSNGDSKGTDIHSLRGGRSVQFNGTNFYITISYNEEDIKYFKNLKGYWQSKIRKWIIKATSENADLIQQKFAFWDQHTYDKIKAIIFSYECPYLVTLYRTPEMTEMVIVEISGIKANTGIIKSTTERCYQKDEKRWTIPNDQVIINRLIADYTRNGAQIVNRLPQEGFDYHKKSESYGQFKTRFLMKTEVELKPIVERYLDTLIAFKRSKKTMTTYLGPFIKFVKYIGVSNIDYIVSKDIDKYMSMISSQKVSDGFLHNAFNAIMFYFRDVLRKNEIVLKEAKRPKKADRLPTILSTGEVDRILRASDNLKHTTILYTFYSSGMRLGEILNLRVEDMWWERSQIFIKNGKGSKDRVVPFSGILKELLQLYFEKYKPIYWLFEGQDRKLPYSERSIQNVVKNVVKKAGINKKVTPHTLRHCYATHLLDGGTDVRYIQELLGHSDIKTTLIYTHVTNHKLSVIESPLDKLMRNRNKNEKDV
jgi:site-specific recombinase XerD